MPICSCFCPSIRPHFQRAHCGSLVSASRSSCFSDTIAEQLCAVSGELLPLDSRHFGFFPFSSPSSIFLPPKLIQTVLTWASSKSRPWPAMLGHTPGARGCPEWPPAPTHHFICWSVLRQFKTSLQNFPCLLSRWKSGSASTPPRVAKPHVLSNISS